MHAYRSLCRLRMLERLTGEQGSLLLPTLTETGNLLSPSMQKWPSHRLLPTLTATSYGSTNNGSPHDGRAEYATKGTPSLETMARSGLLPTLVARDSKGIGPTHSKGGQDLPQVLGGHLSPEFCEWLMGFPLGWTKVDRASQPSATRSSRNKPK